MVEMYIYHHYDRVMAVDSFDQKYPNFDPPAFTTPKRLYDHWKATGSLEDVPKTQPCKVRKTLNFFVLLCPETFLVSNLKHQFLLREIVNFDIFCL